MGQEIRNNVTPGSILRRHQLFPSPGVVFQDILSFPDFFSNKRKEITWEKRCPVEDHRTDSLEKETFAGRTLPANNVSFPMTGCAHFLIHQ